MHIVAQFTAVPFQQAYGKIHTIYTQTHSVILCIESHRKEKKWIQEYSEWMNETRKKIVCIDKRTHKVPSN